jgi:hypothetical protein
MADVMSGGPAQRRKPRGSKRPNALSEESLMSKEQNLKAVALGAEIFPSHDFDRFGEFFAEHIVDHDAADGQAAGSRASSSTGADSSNRSPTSSSRPRPWSLTTAT